MKQFIQRADRRRTMRGAVRGSKSLHSAGTKDLLPSGKISANCKRPWRCVRRRTSRDCPSNGRWGRGMVTRSGRF